MTVAAIPYLCGDAWPTTPMVRCRLAPGHHDDHQGLSQNTYGTNKGAQRTPRLRRWPQRPPDPGELCCYLGCIRPYAHQGPHHPLGSPSRAPIFRRTPPDGSPRLG